MIDRKTSKEIINEMNRGLLFSDVGVVDSMDKVGCSEVAVGESCSNPTFASGA